MYASIKDDEATTPSESGAGGSGVGDDGVEYDINGENGEVVMRTNRRIIDDTNSQIMTMEEIEDMKSQATGSGKELVAKILASHSALDQKTAYALAKYTLRKTKKYMRRFTILPLDVPMLAKWVLTEKEPLKIMEMREEILALIGSWSNVHCMPADAAGKLDGEMSTIGRGRWLVIDETAGLLVASIAEKMGILNPDGLEGRDARLDVSTCRDENELEAQPVDTNSIDLVEKPQEQQQQQRRPQKYSPVSDTNTITLLHANAQPNLSLLKYFHFDPFNPTPSHPLSTHLNMLSWLQLLAPEDDAGYREPEIIPDEDLASCKSGKRSSYFRKRRRWERIKHVVDTTRSGGFDGLIVASVMNPTSIFQHLVPLLRGAAQIVVYSPTIEPLVELADNYSSARRTAFISNPPDADAMPTENFPVNPTLLLAPTIQTARCRSWQVLPGRTHPLMTGKGGSEGYIFTATRVLPAEGKVEARGKFKRRKVVNGLENAVNLSQAIPPATAEGAVEHTMEGNEIDRLDK